MDKYLEELKKEYISSTNDTNLINFNYWLDEKKTHLTRYLEILKYLGLSNESVTFELDRGKYDSISLVDDFNHLFEVSNYANTIDKNVVLIDGKLKINNGIKTIISSNNKKIYFNPNLDFNYISYLKINDLNIFELINTNSNIYYGFYSKLTDLDILDKIGYMEEVKTKLKYLRCFLASFESEINDTYVNILKIRKNYM